MMGNDTIRALTMPKFGLTMKEGKIAKWSVAEGGTLSKGDEVADIETDKITNALEAPVAGLLRRQVVGQDTTLPVGALIGVIADKDVPDDKIDAFISEFKPEQLS
jgi:pyruvate dehydrogenase E2 component (dihydrolipoamide acetyltransferase)